jgi:CHAT domain
MFIRVTQEGPLWRIGSRPPAAPLDPPSAKQIEELRWYIEDFPYSVREEERARADRIRQDWTAVGASLRHFLDLPPETAILEIALPEAVAAPYPWELLEENGRFLAREGLRIVRTPLPSESGEELRPVSGRPLRVLMVISRAEHDEVPFRTIARHLVDVAQRSDRFALEVLRPPALDALEQKLASSPPYDILHFDGHGELVDGRGMLYFDGRAVTAAEFVKPLTRHGVRRIVVNACRSAFASSSAFDSLAAEAMQNGIHSVVAMRFKVLTSTAAAFVSAFYGSLSCGADWSSAVMQARAATPTAELDWCVPVLYSRISNTLVTEPACAPPAPAVTEMDHPGSDAAIQLLDRAFDNHRVVLLYGLAGAGKTTAAREFGAWYSATRGVTGPVVWTSFEQPVTLDDVLEQLRWKLGGAWPEDASGSRPSRPSHPVTPFWSGTTWRQSLDSRLRGTLR